MQGEGQLTYSATHLLLTGERSLRNYNEWIVHTILRNSPPVMPQMKVLDFGAGIGTLSIIFNRITGLKPIGVEIDPAQRKLLQERGYQAHASLSDTPGKFDIIFTSNVLEHIADDIGVLRQLREKINENGTLAIYVPAFQAIWSSLDDKVGHYRRYTKAELRNKLEQSGFAIKTARYCDSIGFFLSLIFKYIGNNSGEPSVKALECFDRYLLPASKILDLALHPYLGKNVYITAMPV